MLIAGKYERSEEAMLGEGAYGCVYKAKDTTNGDSPVAVKELKGAYYDVGITQSGLRELVALKQLSHPHIVKLHDVYATAFHLYLVVELMAMDLYTYLRSKPDNRLPKSEVRQKARQMIDALAYCHAQNLIHRDIKPANILISKDTNTLKLSDYGCAKFVGFPDSRFTTQVVTLFYRAPEVFFGCKNQFGNVDVWAAGCVMYEMASGEPLFATNEPSCSLGAELKQVELLLETLGFPDETTWPGISKAKRYSEFRYLRGILIQPENSDHFESFLKKKKKKAADLCSAQLGLLLKLLTLSPFKRITAANALMHDYFYCTCD